MFFMEMEVLRSGLTSMGTWNVAPPTLRLFTSTCGVMLSRACLKISRGVFPSSFVLASTDPWLHKKCHMQCFSYRRASGCSQTALHTTSLYLGSGSKILFFGFVFLIIIIYIYYRVLYTLCSALFLFRHFCTILASSLGPAFNT